MSNYRVKGLPPIKLENLLKKRRTTLKQFLKDTGIASYVTLVSKAQNMGVSPPDEKTFKEALGEIVSSPQEGVVVLESPSLVDEQTGKKIEVDVFEVERVTNDDAQDDSVVVQEPDVERLSTTKQSKKKNK